MNGEYGEDDPADDFVPDNARLQFLLRDFVAAAARNDLVAAHNFLGVYMDHADDTVSDLTALMVAARAGHLEMVRLLLDHGVNIDRTNSEGCTALMLAADAGRADVATYLLEHGADATMDNCEEMTAEQLATAKGHSRVARILRDGVPQVPDMDLRGDGALSHNELVEYGQAINLGDVDAVVAFLDAHPSLLDAPCAFGSVSLLRAVAQGQAGVVEILLQRGAQADVIDPKDGSTPLTRACWEGQIEIVRLLINAGADVNMKSRAGLTPLVMAVCGRHADVAQALLDAEADPELTNRQGRTPIQLAQVRGFTQMQELLTPYLEKAVRRRQDAEVDRQARAIGRVHLQQLRTKNATRSPFNKGGPKP